MAGNEKVEINDEEFIGYYNEGLSYQKIADKMQISKTKAQREAQRLRMQGKIAERESKTYNPNPQIKLNVEELVELFKSGQSQRAIADIKGVSERTAREKIKAWFEANSTLEEYNNYIQKNRTNATNSLRVNLPRKEFIQMVNEGYSNRKIAEHFGVAHSTVGDFRARLGI